MKKLTVLLLAALLVWTALPVYAADEQKDAADIWANPYTDITDSDWCYNDVAYVTRRGLFQGTTDTAFLPGISMSRAMLVTVLWRLEGETIVNCLMQYEDVSPDAWCAQAVRWASSEKLVTGYSAQRFAPDDTVTREQLVTILYRYAVTQGFVTDESPALNNEFWDVEEISSYAVEAMQWAVSEGLIQGDRGMLMPGLGVNRAQVAAILHRFCERYAV